MKKDDLLAEERIKTSLLENHIHFLCGDIETQNITEAIKWIVYENFSNSNKPLTLYINSDGGSLQDAFALIDMMQKSVRPIRTIGIGSVCSAAFLIFTAGTKGQRFISKNASIMCHQFSDEYTGKYHDIKAALKENDWANNRMVDILKHCTGLDTKTIKNKLLPPTDVWFTADEIVAFGVADAVF